MRRLVSLLSMDGLLLLAVTAPMVGVLAYYWISCTRPQTDVWDIAAAPPWALISALATVLGCLIAREQKRVRRNGVVVLAALFLVLTTISTMMALGPSGIVIHFCSQTAKALFFLLVLAALLTERHRVRALVWAMVISPGSYRVTGGLFPIATDGQFRVRGPADSIIGDNNGLAVAVRIVLPLRNCRCLRSAHSLVRKGLAVAMPLTLVSTLASYSRGALLGLTPVALFFWWNNRHKLQWLLCWR